MPDLTQRGILATWEQVLRRPRRFFSEPPSQWSGWSPLTFVALTVAAAIGLSELLAVVQGRGVDSHDAEMMVVRTTIAPLAVALLTLVWGAVSHATLVVIGGRRVGIRGTTACVCYASTPQLLGMGLAQVSTLATVFCWGWSVALAALGLGCVHKTEAWKACVASLSFHALLVAMYLLIQNAVAV